MIKSLSFILFVLLGFSFAVAQPDKKSSNVVESKGEKKDSVALHGLKSDSLNFAGIWRMDVFLPGKVKFKWFFIIHQDRNKFDGKVIGTVELPLVNPHMEGNELVFTNWWGLHCRLRSEGNRLLVKFGYGGVMEEGIAYRVPIEETYPAKGAPLPPLVTVPSNGLAKTPPMGWNSWNRYQFAVSDSLIRKMADKLVSTGLAETGYVYVVIDEGWSGYRDTDGNIVPNEKFPDMKALSEYVHSRGLKLGIHSSPGPLTCGGYPGSYGHEEQDAKTFASWGIDYLKYDWCSAERLYKEDQLQAVYQKMGTALVNCGRPIVYSVCEYGKGKVWEWGPKVGANLWRTTGDISDNWKRVSEIGFAQDSLSPYAGPGHWNDPDMLEVGNGGMTNTEYRSHFSLWCLLASPLFAGNDLTNMSTETLEILSNKEAIAVDQDPLCKQAIRVVKEGDIQIWERDLKDGSKAVGLFNLGLSTAKVTLNFADIKVTDKQKIRDLWLHKDLGWFINKFEAEVDPHGVVFLEVVPGQK